MHASWENSMRPAESLTMDWGITIRAVAMQRTMSRHVTPVPSLICRSPRGVPSRNATATIYSIGWSDRVRFLRRICHNQQALCSSWSHEVL